MTNTNLGIERLNVIGRGGLMPQQNKHWARALSDALNLTTTIVAAVAVGYFAGKWLDGKFDTDPWLTVAGFLLGLATAFKSIWDRMNADQKSSNNIKDKEEDKT